MKHSSPGSSSLMLGIDGGATRTVAILASLDGTQIQRIEAGPANLKLLSDEELERHLLEIAAQVPKPASVAIGLAGNWSEQDSTRIRGVAARIWPGVPCHASNDLETALAAGTDISEKLKQRVLVLSGTGSCCYGKDGEGRGIKVGSGGHMVADTASAFQLSVQALRGVFARFEETGKWPELGGVFLRTMQFNQPDDLIGWANTASKRELSRLAPAVLQAWENGDPIAKAIVARESKQFARQAMICAKRLGYKRGKVCFVLAGSMLLKQPKFQRAVSDQLRRYCPGCVIAPLMRESAWGAVELAKLNCNGAVSSSTRQDAPAAPVVPTSEGLSSTEERNPRSIDLDKLSVSKAIELMLSEDARISDALLECRKDIEEVIRMIVSSFKKGGSLFYVGAGTSGRLGVLDASECPPTFRTKPEMVQGIMAGGMAALWQSLESEEDDFGGGAKVMEARALKKTDTVIGIAASGTTPFVWGALSYAKKIGASTVLVTFNSRLHVPEKCRPDVIICPKIGPEVLTGSTRLKAGTATKLLLNMFTTLSMVKLGKVRSNLMIDVNPSNVKLRERAVRMLCQLTGASPEISRKALEENGWLIKRAINIASAAMQR